MKRQSLTSIILCLLGGALVLTYVAALRIGDLREHTSAFLFVYVFGLVLYGGVTLIVLQQERQAPGMQAEPGQECVIAPRLPVLGGWRLAAVALFGAAAMMVPLLWTRPALSDDMYRYVWDGRVQAEGVSPYRYPPDAIELYSLRDRDIWRHINRKPAVTIYPPGAELAFALLWRIRPDSIRWFQMAMALGALAAGALLLGLLRDLGRSTARVLIFLWSPLLIYETGHAAHVDGLLLPLLVGAWWARVRSRDTLTGVLLGLATATKLYPVLLLPALWRIEPPSKADRGGQMHRYARAWRMPLAFLATLSACYAPYVIQSGPGVLGYLPKYFGERFNMGLAAYLIPLFERAGLDPNRGMVWLTLVALAVLGIAMVLKPAASGEEALRRCLWLIATFTLLTQNLFSWYMLWLLPLVAIFLSPGRPLGLRLDGWTGWWLFCGLVGLSYSFFIRWRPVPWALWLQYGPLYAPLLIDAVRRSRALLAQRGR